MEVKYYKEQHRKYMVIHQTEDDERTGYHVQMLRSRKMDHLLKVNIRVLNGEKYTYYDITSKLTLKQLLGSKSLSSDDISSLFSALKAACDEIDSYLLDPARLILNPDMIFYSCDKDRYYFLYNVSIPISETDKELGVLMDYLLDKADGEDEEASDIIYRLYEQYEKGALDVFGITDTIGNISDEKKDIQPVYDVPDSDPEPVPFPEPPLPAAGISPSDNKRRRYLPIMLMIAGAAGIIAGGAVSMTFKLEPDEKLFLTAEAVTSGIILIAGIILAVTGRLKRNLNADSPAPVLPYENVYENVYTSGQSSLHMQDFTASAPRPIRHEKHTASDTEPAETGDNDTDTTEPTREGLTVFFDESPADGTYKLYAMDRKNKKHIELDHLPITIGKMNGYVDRVIDHPSISRIHARVEMSGDRLMLSDLNSTNGVFLNGIRLSPNEQREIEEGDEIRFGSLNYCLRKCG